MKKTTISIILIITVLTMYMLPAMAVSQSDVDDMSEQKQEVEDKKDEVTEQKESLMDEISELTTQISKYESEISELNNKIEELEISISDKEEEIKKLEKETEEKKELLIDRLVAMYEAGQTTYLDVLLASEDMTSLISNYYRIEEIAEADQEVIDSIIEKQEQTEKAKKELEEEKKEVNTSKEEVQEKNSSLKTAKSSKQEKVNSLSAEEKELQSKIDEFESQIKNAKKEIEAQRKKNESNNNSSGSGSSSSSNNLSYQGSFDGILSWPISSNSSYYNYISSYFGPRPSPTAGASSNHGAIDIPVRYVPVYSAANGTIVSAGWVSGYGNYIEIDHGNGYYTAYGHLSSISVSPGQTVSRGQQIAISGNTGVSTGPHLHYEVYIGGLDLGYRVDPLQYTTHGTLYSL